MVRASSALSVCISAFAAALVAGEVPPLLRLDVRSRDRERGEGQGDRGQRTAHRRGR